MKGIFLRTAIGLLASIGVLGVGRISIIHWTGEASCPMISSLPACYIILIAYILIVLSMYPRLQKALIVFLIGWVPVTSLALYWESEAGVTGGSIRIRRRGFPTRLFLRPEQSSER